MTRAHRDATGQVWPAGTVYQPRSSGIDNTLPGSPNVARIVVGGEVVTFIGRPNSRPIHHDVFTADNTAGISPTRLGVLNRRYWLLAERIDPTDPLADQRHHALRERVLRQAGAA